MNIVSESTHSCQTPQALAADSNDALTMGPMYSFIYKLRVYKTKNALINVNFNDVKESGVLAKAPSGCARFESSFYPICAAFFIWQSLGGLSASAVQFSTGQAYCTYFLSIILLS